MTKKEHLQFENYRIYYDNINTAKQTINEIFSSNQYAFQLNKTNPVIIDCGANIGIATLYFKKIYPNSRIICFEPNPIVFQTLNENIHRNEITNVSLFNYALYKCHSQINLYGELHNNNPDTLGTSILSGWGLQRKSSAQIKVQATTLSQYINSTIDFLKLDIEGAEQIVLEEIEHKLKMVRQLVIEVHETKNIIHKNSLKKIIALLKHHNFSVDWSVVNVQEQLPAEIKPWQSQNEPCLYIVRAINLVNDT